MTDTINPTLPLVALLKPQMPSVYERSMIYDPNWDNPAYNSYTGQKIIPQIGSLVKDTDDTPLWVVSVDPVTYVPSYLAVPLSTQNDNVVSLLDYGNSVFRLYVDKRALPYPATPDSKCIFIGKSPRYYTLTRYAGTANETIISQYFDASGKLVSTLVPLVALDSSKSSWYLPRSAVAVTLEDNEEITAKIFSEDGSEVFSALLFAKESSVINENVLYSPTVVGITVSGNQQLANGTFFLYEKQDFGSLGLTATLVYDDGNIAQIPIDNVKCILYGQSDFISSFSGLKQNLTLKYFRSQNEALSSSIADKTGEMISVTIPVTVIPNALATTNKIVVIPLWNVTLSRYIIHYWLYFADGRSHLDVTAYCSIKSGVLVTDRSYFGVTQTYVIGLDMNQVDPVHYPTPTVYQQNVALTLNPSTVLVKWSFADSINSPYTYGLDNASSRCPQILWDSTRSQYFIPTTVFTNLPAFINSFYTNSAPPFDPSVSQTPQSPTHFVVRNVLTGSMIIAGKIDINNYAQAFTVVGDTTGNYVNATVMVEFINVINANQTNILFASPVSVSTGAYLGT